MTFKKEEEGTEFKLSQTKLFDTDILKNTTWKGQVAELNLEIDQLEIDIQAVKDNKIYENAMEWRFEFPEVLDNEGTFKGFDAVVGNPPYIRQELLGGFKDYFKKEYKVFVSGGDIFSYFYERTLNLLKNDGYFCFINNTFDKTTAGKTLRDYIQANFSIIKYIDLTSVVVFAEATTYPIIMVMQKTKCFGNVLEYKKVLPETFDIKDSQFRDSKKIELLQNQLNSSVWNFTTEKQSKLLEKIQKHPILLSCFGKCYYGIKTGLNEAFITDLDLQTSEYADCVYVGKEIKKWHSPEPIKKLIVFKSKSTRLKYGNLTEEKALIKMKKEYPKIFKHLIPFEAKAIERVDKGEYWWELRNCAYYDLFPKSKIIFPNLQNSNKFSFDESGYYINAPAVFLPTDEKYLLAIFNSKVVWHFLTSICVVRNGGFIEVKPQYFEQIPIPEISEDMQIKLTDKVNLVIDTCKKGDNKGTLRLEKEIDTLVYELYGLNKEDIKIIEGM